MAWKPCQHDRTVYHDRTHGTWHGTLTIGAMEQWDSRNLGTTMEQ